MAKYLVTFESCEDETDTDCIAVAKNRDEVDEIIKGWMDEGYMDDGEMPIVYQLGKKMKTEIETKITLKGESA